MKWLKRILLGLVAFIAIVLVLVFVLSQRRLTHTYTVTRAGLTLPTDSVALARGEHIATAIGKCVGCHGEKLEGKAFISDGGFGTIPAPNLTRGKGGAGTRFTDADYEAAIRHGVGPDGKPLVIMPAEGFTALSGSDVRALIAYIRSRPPVDNQEPVRSIGPIGRMILAFGAPLLPAEQIKHDVQQPDDVAPAVSAEYGSYLVAVGSCRSCHNPSLSGGPMPGAKPGEPIPQNLTRGGLANWTVGDFRRALREGRRPEGTTIDTMMPWRLTKLLTDVEIDAMWAYLQSLPPKEFGKQ